MDATKTQFFTLERIPHIEKELPKKIQEIKSKENMFSIPLIDKVLLRGDSSLMIDRTLIIRVTIQELF